MSGRSSRRKGHAGEREVARAMEHVYPMARRGLQYASGRNEADVENTPFWVECKRGKACRIKPALEQARRDADRRAPMAVTRDDGGEWIVSMYLKDFLHYVNLLRNRMSISEFDAINTEVV